MREEERPAVRFLLLFSFSLGYYPLICPKCGGTMRVIRSYIHDEDVIWQILNHLGLLEEESAGSLERAPPDGLPPAREITYESFFDDLPAGEIDEDWFEAVMNVGTAN